MKLHVSVQRKQEEISALKEKNAQLKELVKQAEIYADVLDVSQAKLIIMSKMICFIHTYDLHHHESKFDHAVRNKTLCNVLL